MVKATWPPQVQILAGKVEDELAEWVKRDPARPTFATLRHGERARRLLRDLIDRLVELDGELGGEVEVYGEAVRRVRDVSSCPTCDRTDPEAETLGHRLACLRAKAAELGDEDLAARADMLRDRVDLAQANAFGLPSAVDDEYERLLEESDD